MRGFDTSGNIFIKNNVHDILYSIQTVFLLLFYYRIIQILMYYMKLFGVMHF